MSDNVVCALGHRRKAMECPSCCGSPDVKWWKWYRTRTSSSTVKAAIDAYLARAIAGSEAVP